MVKKCKKKEIVPSIIDNGDKEPSKYVFKEFEDFIVFGLRDRKVKK